jgi:hypothetical protein
MPRFPVLLILNPQSTILNPPSEREALLILNPQSTILNPTSERQ